MLYGELRVKTDARQKLITQQQQDPVDKKLRVPPPIMPKRFSYGDGSAGSQASSTDRSQIPTKKSMIEEVRLIAMFYFIVLTIENPKTQNSYHFRRSLVQIPTQPKINLCSLVKIEPRHSRVP